MKVFRSNRTTYDGAVCADIHNAESDLERKRAQAKRELGKRYQMHPASEFHWDSDPTILPAFIRSVMQAESCSAVLYRIGIIK